MTLTPAEATAASYCVANAMFPMVSRELSVRLDRERKHPGPCRFCPRANDRERRQVLCREIVASHNDAAAWITFGELSREARYARIREAAEPTPEERAASEPQWWESMDSRSTMRTDG